MLWIQLQPNAHPDMLGYIPEFLSEADPRPAAEQFAEKYIGGWRAMRGGTLDEGYRFCFPGDPPLSPLFITALGDELVLVYPSAFVAIVQADRSFEFSRLD